MDLSQFPAVCGICGTVPGFDAWGCLLCGRLLCGRHFSIERGVAICSDCQPERRRLESAGIVKDADEARLVALLTRDLLATVGPGAEGIAIAEAARVRLFAETLQEYERRVVEDVQQRLHDERVDTTWPACPVHANHPLWCSDGWWRCKDGGAVARLGELAARLGVAGR